MQLVALRVAQWLGGLSLSSVILLAASCITTLVLRRKGYRVRIGVDGSFFFRARHGSRRFPNGCEVRIASRFVGFMFGGLRGPWIDVSTDRFDMRLRQTVPTPPRGGWFHSARRYVARFAAVEQGYWSTVLHNTLTRIVAFVVRGLRVRARKVRVWQDGGSWEFRAEQLVLAGRAVGVFGSKYTLSVNELYVDIRRSPVIPESAVPIDVSLVLQKGVELTAFLTPRIYTLLRPRRMAILDDLRFSVALNDVACNAGELFNATLANVSVELCPGYSRSLRAKLPPSAPATRRPRKPSILRYWEGTGSIDGLALRFAPPLSNMRSTDASAMRTSSDSLPPMSLPPSLSASVMPPPSAPSFTAPREHRDDGSSIISGGAESATGCFFRLQRARIEAYGMAGDERQQPMTRASLNICGCSAGSLAVDTLSRNVYESKSQSDASDHVEKIVAARPEALLWLEDVNAALDINCSKRHAMRVEVGGRGVLAAMEPVGLAKLIRGTGAFVAMYVPPTLQRNTSSSSLASDGASSLIRSASSGSLGSIDGESEALRLLCELRQCTVIALGHGPTGDGDTLAIVVSAQTASLPVLDHHALSGVRLEAALRDFALVHWTQWTRTENIVCREVAINVNQTKENLKRVSMTGLTADWDLDLQSGLEALPNMFAALKGLREPRGDDDDVLGDARVARPVVGRVLLTEAERRERRERRRGKLIRTLDRWRLTGTDLSVAASFPDGPRLAVKCKNLPEFAASAEKYVGQHVVLTIHETSCLYCAEIQMDNPLHSLARGVERRKMEIDVQGLRLLMQEEFQFGPLLQDWLLRLRAVMSVMRTARFTRRGLPVPRSRKRPLPDILVRAEDVEVYFEDHPIGSFLTRMLPLMQDEARERVIREELMSSRVAQLQKIARAQLAGTPELCLQALHEIDSDVWIKRVRALKDALPSYEVAKGHLPPLNGPPVTKFVAATLNFSMTMDEVTRRDGVAASLAKMKRLDEYELGPKKFHKTRQYDGDAWNSLGFRDINFEACGVRLRFRDYPVAFVVIDRMYFDKTILGQAVQATLPPYVAETSVAVGRRRVVKIVKGLGSAKVFADIHLIIDTLQCGYNPAFLGAIGDFGRTFGRFFGGGKNPSPRIPWFDTLRVNTHGQMRITAKKLKGHLASSVSPYTITKHFAEVEADNVSMLASRLAATPEDHFPISWELHNWHIRPHQFRSDVASEIVFDSVKVGLIPQPQTNSGDTQDHYFVPFPSKEQVEAGGPGIGRGRMTLTRLAEPVTAKLNPLRNFTTWRTGLHDIPGFDSFVDFKTMSLILGVDVYVQHAKVERPGGGSSCAPQEQVAKFWAPPGTSVVHSDAITTLIKVIKMLIKRPTACRLAPRQIDRAKKPPCREGLSVRLMGLDLNINVRDVNVMLYNNLQPGHGLFLSVSQVTGELRKRTTILAGDDGKPRRVAKLTRRKFEALDFHSSIRVPDLDLAGDATDTGRLLSVGRVLLSDDVNDQMDCLSSPSLMVSANLPSSGFGGEDYDESPFYTFSATHAFQRGKKLDKVSYDVRLMVYQVRLLWTPSRRTSLLAWPDAFKEKAFSMKAPPRDLADACAAAASKHQSDIAARRRCSAMPFGERRELDQGRGRELESDEEETTEDEVLLQDEVDDDSRKEESGGEGADNAKEYLPTGRRKVESVVASADGYHGERRVQSMTGDDSASALGVKNSDSMLIRRSQQMLRPTQKNVRTKSTAGPRPTGSMVDLLDIYPAASMPAPRLSADTKVPSDEGRAGDDGSASEKSSTPAVCVNKVLQTCPKFIVYVNDSQICFGSPETSGLVFLTSRAASVGIVDKTVERTMQSGGKHETWVDREYRAHLNESDVYSQSTGLDSFSFSANRWVPANAARKPASDVSPLSRVTTRPISMDLMYIKSSTPAKDDEDKDEDHILRPALLFINLPDISMSSTSMEFHAIIDVVRKVLMQRVVTSGIVNKELALLRYNLQLAGGRLTTEDLDEFMRRLNNITKQFLYAGDTFQPELVQALLLPDESSFAASLQRYKAKAKAVATFMRKDQRASTASVLYPTMYLSYSFDKISWELKADGSPFVEITLYDFVCRHIFYIGRGSSAEVTFVDISAKNRMHRGYFQGILQPSRTRGGDAMRNTSKIKASDGTPVAFRWYSNQTDRVGGIPVYELLTIQLAPMSAAVSRRLYSAVYTFIFSGRKNAESASGTSAGVRQQQSTSASAPDEAVIPHQSRIPRPSYDGSTETSSGRRLRRIGSSMSAGVSSAISRSQLDEVTQMERRGESTMLFKYVFIDTLELTASYKNKEEQSKSVLDFFDLFVTTPSFSYSSQVWTWKDFTTQIRKDLLMTFARRGVSNLAKIKLLPGYSRARRRLVQGADNFRESIYSRLPSGYGESEIDGQERVTDDDVELTAPIGESQTPSGSESSSDVELEPLPGDEDGETFVEDLDMPLSEDLHHREVVLTALYGPRAVSDGRSSGSPRASSLEYRRSTPIKARRRSLSRRSLSAMDPSTNGDHSSSGLLRSDSNRSPGSDRPPTLPSTRRRVASYVATAAGSAANSIADSEAVPEALRSRAPRTISFFNKVRRRAQDYADNGL